MDVKQDAIMAGMLARLQSRARARPDDQAVAWREIQLLRGLGELERANQACASFIERWPRHEEARSLMGCLRGEPRPISDETPIGPAPFVHCKDFLGPEDHGAIVDGFAEVAARDSDLTVAAVTNASQKYAVEPEKRDSFTFDLPQRLEDLFLAAVWPRVAEWRRVLGLGREMRDKVEIRGGLYRDGGFFHRHRDRNPKQVKAGQRRLIVLIYSAHPEPCSFAGGGFDLWDADRSGDAAPAEFTRFPATNNSLLVFRADTWHAVRPVISLSDSPTRGRWNIRVFIHELVKN